MQNIKNIIINDKKMNNATSRRRLDSSLLPSPQVYYRRVFPNLKIKPRWTQVACCFHDDKTPSLSINLVEGHFRCFGCGAKGKDVIAFHQLRNGMSFIEAVTDLGAWCHEY